MHYLIGAVAMLGLIVIAVPVAVVAFTLTHGPVA